MDSNCRECGRRNGSGKKAKIKEAVEAVERRRRSSTVQFTVNLRFGSTSSGNISPRFLSHPFHLRLSFHSIQPIAVSSNVFPQYHPFSTHTIAITHVLSVTRTISYPFAPLTRDILIYFIVFPFPQWFLLHRGGGSGWRKGTSLFKGT